MKTDFPVGNIQDCWCLSDYRMKNVHMYIYEIKGLRKVIQVSNEKKKKQMPLLGMQAVTQVDLRFTHNVIQI